MKHMERWQQNLTWGARWGHVEVGPSRKKNNVEGETRGGTDTAVGKGEQRGVEKVGEKSLRINMSTHMEKAGKCKGGKKTNSLSGGGLGKGGGGGKVMETPRETSTNEQMGFKFKCVVGGMNRPKWGGESRKGLLPNLKQNDHESEEQEPNATRGGNVDPPKKGGDMGGKKQNRTDTLGIGGVFQWNAYNAFPGQKGTNWRGRRPYRGWKAETGQGSQRAYFAVGGKKKEEIKRKQNVRGGLLVGWGRRVKTVGESQIGGDRLGRYSPN